MHRMEERNLVDPFRRVARLGLEERRAHVVRSGLLTDAPTYLQNLSRPAQARAVA